MAKVKIDGLNPRAIKLSLDSEGLINNKNKKRISSGTITAISSFIKKDYTETVINILDLYTGKGLSRTSYDTGDGRIGVSHPKFSGSHSRYIRSKGLDPNSKPFWGAILGDLASYARQVRVSDSASVSSISFEEKITSSNSRKFFNRLLGGKLGDKVEILTMSATISLPEISSPLLDTSISNSYLKELTDSTISFAIALPRSESKKGARPEHAIYGEEKFRPLIAPVAEFRGNKAFGKLLKTIDITLSDNIKGNIFGKIFNFKR